LYTADEADAVANNFSVAAATICGVLKRQQYQNINHMGY
jgi:hypothetical protein